MEGQNPYETADLFAVSPREVFVEDGTVSFTFPSTLHMANVTQAVQSIQVSFDEGLAYRNTVATLLTEDKIPLIAIKHLT